MKDIKGWIALGIFCITCCFIGMQGFLLKKLNITVIAMLAVSVVIVLLLDEFKKKPDCESKNKGE